MNGIVNDESEQYGFWIAQQDLPADVRHLYPDGALVIMDGINVVEMVHITEDRVKDGIRVQQLLKLSWSEWLKWRDKHNPRRKLYFSQTEAQESWERGRGIMLADGIPLHRYFYARLDSGKVVRYTTAIDLDDENQPDEYSDYVYLGIGRFDHAE